jgi:hypothetical protein
MTSRFVSLGYAARRLGRDERDLVEDALNGKLEIWAADNRAVSVLDSTPATSTSAPKGPAAGDPFDIDLGVGRATTRTRGPFMVPPAYLALVLRGDLALFSGAAMFDDGSTQIVESLIPLRFDTLCMERAAIDGDAFRAAEPARSASRLATETTPAPELATTPPPSRSARQRRADARNLGTILLLLLEADVEKDPRMANETPEVLAQRMAGRFGTAADATSISACVNAIHSDINDGIDQDFNHDFTARAIMAAAVAAGCRSRGRIVPTRLANRADALRNRFPKFSTADEKTLQRWLSQHVKNGQPTR